MLEKITKPLHPLKLTTRQKTVLLLILFIIGGGFFAVACHGMTGQSGLGQVNQNILDWLSSNRSAAVSKFMAVYATVMRPEFITIAGLCASIIWAIWKRHVWLPLLLFGGTGLVAALSLSLKSLTHNHRPDKLIQLPPFENSFSFPSAHVAVLLTVSLLIIYILYSRQVVRAKTLAVLLVVAVTLAAIMALDRLYLAAHWPTDVVGGVGLALITVAITVAIDCLYSWFANSRKLIS